MATRKAPWEVDSDTDTAPEKPPTKKPAAKKAPAKKAPAKKAPAKRKPAEKQAPAAPAFQDDVPTKHSGDRVVSLDEVDLLATLEEWRLAKLDLEETKPVVKREQELRAKVAALFFPNPVEGTNKVGLPGNWELKYSYKLDRKIDEAVLQETAIALREMEFNPDLLVEWKPGVKLAVYRELTDEQRKVFDAALIVKPGSPTVELVPPKEKK